MTREEQEQRVYENVPKVYEAGRNSLKDVVANALVGSAIGEAVALRDVSKIEHSLAVRVSSKNLFDMASYILSNSALSNSTVNYDNSNIYFERINTTQYTPSIGWIIGKWGDFKGKKLTLSFNLEESNTRLNVSVLNDNPFTSGTATTINQKNFETTDIGYCTFSFTGPDILTDNKPLFIRFYLNKATNIGDYIKISNLQIEFGTAATAYTPYIADIEAVKLRAQGKNLINIDADMVTAFADVEKLDYKTFKITKSVGAAYLPRANIYLGKYKDFKGKTITASIKRIGKTGTSSNTADILYICNGVFERAEKADFPYVKTVTVSGTENTSNASVVNITIPNDLEYEDMYFRIYTQSALNEGEYSIYTDFQVELSETATEYEPYIEPIEYAQGEVIKSIYPTTTLTTDTPGALIEVEYNRDINKAFAELQQAIISLGGNV